jgi:nicotinamidase-related amidase
MKRFALSYLLACLASAFPVQGSDFATAAFRNKGTALLVIDMQKELTSPDARICVSQPDIETIIRNINNFLKAPFSRGMTVIYLLYRPGTKGPKNGLARRPGTETPLSLHEVDPRIIRSGSIVFSRERPDAFTSSAFCDYLKKSRIERLFVSGIVAEGCVYATAMQALSRGFDVTLLADAVAGSSRNAALEVLDRLKRSGARVLHPFSKNQKK